MRCVAYVLVMVVAGVLVASSVSAVQGAEKKAQQKSSNDWRYVYHNGQWWYWLPEGRWLYWQNNRWNAHSASKLDSRSAIAGTQSGGRDSGQVDADTRPFYGRALSTNGDASNGGSDIRPFYGRTYADPDRRQTVPNGETGPFYGRTLPSELRSGR